MATEFVWIFNGSKGKFPGGVFSSLQTAEQWILAHNLTGVLTKYPVNIGSFDWAKENGFVSEKLEGRADSEFIASFSSASFDHFHYEVGKRQ
jgi:hypothetical protein